MSLVHTPHMHTHAHKCTHTHKQIGFCQYFFITFFHLILHINYDNYFYVVPEREVSPKFVFGKKKYGRRSRPESTEQEVTLEQDESDDSDLDIFVPVGDENKDITMVIKL